MIPNISAIIQLTLLVAVVIALFFLACLYWIRKKENKDYRFEDLFMPRKKIYFQLDKKELLEFSKKLESLPLEQRIFLLKFLIGRSCKVFLSTDPHGSYIDGVAIHSEFVEQEEQDKSIG